MSDLSLCRVCLIGNTKTFSVVNTPLQVLYENLTNNKLVTQDGRPDAVCSICLRNLLNCYKFKKKSSKSGEILNQLSKHGIEILPETLSVLNAEIKQDYCLTPVENFTYGGPYDNIPVKKEIKTEYEPPSISPVEDLGPDAKLCRVCLAVSTKAYKLGQLEALYDKITDSKVRSTDPAVILCYLCHAGLRRCKDIVTNASKSEKILAEFHKNGIQLSQQTVNIINLKLKSRFTRKPVKTFSLNAHDTIPVSKQAEKQSSVVETNIEIVIKRERDRNHVHLDQNCEDLGQYCEQFNQNCDELGQSGDNPDRNIETSEQNSGKSGNTIGHSGDDSEQSGDVSEQSGDEYDPSGDEPEQSGDEYDPSGDKPEQSGNEYAPSGDETDISDQRDKEAVPNCGEVGDYCKVCKAELNSQEKVERHKRLHDPKRPYACNKCSYRYERKSHLNFHKATHRYNNKCDVCDKSFTHIRLLKRHMWLHNGKVYTCRICATVFRYGHEISKHNLAKHPDINYDCKFCKKAFTAEHRLLEHVFKDHARDFPHYICDYCRKKFKDFHILRRHMILVHLKSFKHKCGKCLRYFSKSAALCEHKKICCKKEEIVYKCELCPKSYFNKHSLIRHEIIHTGEKNFKCEICDKAFRDKYAIKNHLKCHNPDSMRLTCDVCGKAYLNKNSYQEHVKTHNTGIKKPHSCDECHMTFTTKYQLRRHKNNHSENPKDKPKYDCQICNKKVASLSTHMRVHSDNKPFACDVCDKAFRHKQNLLTHKTTHGTDERFVCDTCGKSFIRKSTLKSHIRNIHTERVKTHACTHCEKAFGTSVQLKSHTRTHTGERPYKCEKCHKQYSELRVLQLHELREHANVKKSNYICDLCHKVYLEKKDMIRHVKTHKGRRNFRCGVCHKLFLDMFTLYWHLKTHAKKSGHKLYCRFCKKSFTAQLSLNRHYASCHDGYKEFACNICEQGFACYQTLNFHIQKSHKIGYSCSLCMNVLSERRNLLAHMVKVHGLKQK